MKLGFPSTDAGLLAAEQVNSHADASNHHGVRIMTLRHDRRNPSFGLWRK
jgi:hypothetical protein